MIRSGSVTGSLRNQVEEKRTGHLGLRAARKGLHGKGWKLVHSRRVIQIMEGKNAEEKEESEGFKDTEGDGGGSEARTPWSWTCFCFSGKRRWNVAPCVVTVNFQGATEWGGSQPTRHVGGGVN